MNERLFPMEKKPDRVRIVSNILYEELKKHKDNRHLNYVFDNDFVSKQQVKCYRGSRIAVSHLVDTHKSDLLFAVILHVSTYDKMRYSNLGPHLQSVLRLASFWLS